MSAPGNAAAKTALRARLLARRRGLGEAAVERARDAVRAAVLDRCAVAGWSVVACYRPLRTEPGSVRLLERLRRSGVRVLVPLTLPDRDLDWARWPDTAPQGRDAVAAAGAVLVPALAVDRSGTRLGRGGGSYDRALARVRPGTAVAALLHDGELLDRLPRDSWDVPVTAAVSPRTGWIEPGGPGWTRESFISDDG